MGGEEKKPLAITLEATQPAMNRPYPKGKQPDVAHYGRCRNKEDGREKHKKRAK